MKRSWLTLFGGVALALIAYFGFYFVSTARYRSLEHREEPELAWLQREFHLTDAEFSRISRLHEAYLGGCAERCHRIDLINEQLRTLLSATNSVTPDIERALLQAAQLRAECQKQMLQHFFEVSRTMPPNQGQRYLAWVQGRTVLADTHSQMHH